jgi:hypothetical protein
MNTDTMVNYKQSSLYLKNNIFKIREFTMIDYLLNFLVKKNKFTNMKVHYL